MYYTVYKIINLINGKVYIGVHITSNLNDEYMGSGKYLKNAINKYGKDNFKKEILFQYNNIEDMFLKEKELVNEEWVNRKDTYNLKIGGDGGWSYINQNGMNKNGNQNVFQKSEKLKKYFKLNPKKHSLETKKKIGKKSKELNLIKYAINANIGKSKTQLQKKKISESLKKYNEQNKNIVKCPYCEKNGYYPLMKRWHFDNCKKRIS